MNQIFSLKKKKAKINKYRIYFLAGFILILAFFLIYRLFILQVLEHKNYIALASGQYEIYKKLFPQRGNIYIIDDQMVTAGNSEKKLFPLATNRTLFEVYAQPNFIKDPEKIAEHIFGILEIKDPEQKDIIINKLSKEKDPYEPIMKKVDKEKSSGPLMGVNPDTDNDLLVLQSEFEKELCVRCPICKKDVISQDFKAHLEKEHKDLSADDINQILADKSIPIICPLCGISIGSPVRHHFRKVHSLELDTFANGIFETAGTIKKRDAHLAYLRKAKMALIQE